MSETATKQSPGIPVLLLVDGHAYAYRAFYAIRSLSSPSGAPTNAIYGFIKMLQKLVSFLNPSHVAVIWDGGLATGRTDAHPEYKANRPEMPGDLETQLDQIVSYLNASGIASLCADGIEADDWIAGLAKSAELVQSQVVIASADKDFLQLVQHRVAIVNPNDKEMRLWNEADVVAKTGVSPCQIVDWLSLIGDAVDNIPGVPGVGPKTAASLLQKHQTLDGVYANLHEVSSDRVRNALSDAKSDVFRNRELIRLWDDKVPQVKLEDLKLGREKSARLAALYHDWGFKTMLRELEQRQKEPEPLLSLGA